MRCPLQLLPTNLNTDGTLIVVAVLMTMHTVAVGAQTTATAQPVSTIQGPTIVQARCGLFSTAFNQWYPHGWDFEPEPLGYGMQMCTWITDWPTSPVVVTNGALNVVFPVIYLGDPQDGPGTYPTYTGPTNYPYGQSSTVNIYYPYGQSHANYSATVTASDTTAVAPVSGASLPNTNPQGQAYDCGGSQLIAGSPVTATFQGWIAGNVMTVTAMATSGNIYPLQTVSGPGVAPGTQITAILSGTGTTGTYTLNIPQSVGSSLQSETMTTGAGAQEPQSQATGSITLYDYAAPDAPAGAKQTGQQAANQISGVAYGSIVVPINASWAQSILTFSIAVSQGVPGNDPEDTTYELPPCPAGKLCRPYPIWNNQATFNTTNSPPSPSYYLISCVGQSSCACPQPQAVEVDVIPFAAFQLGYLPLAVIYSPIGNKATASYTLSDISGTQISFGATVTAVNSLTSDDKEVQTGTVSGKGGSASIAGTWDSTVETDEGTLYGQVATVTSTGEIDQQLPNTLPSTGPSSWPSTDKMDYYHEPFHHDIIVAAVNPQFMIWSYPEGFFTMPIGSAGFFEATVDDLATCAGGLIAKSFGAYSVAPADCRALLSVDAFAALDTQALQPNNFLNVTKGNPTKGDSVYVSTGVIYTNKDNTGQTVASNTGSTYTANVTGLNSLAVSDTQNPLALAESDLNISYGLTTTTSSTDKTTITMNLTAMSSDTLQNSITSSNQILDSNAPATFQISYNALQDPYFGTIAFQDITAGTLPKCPLVTEPSAVTFNPAPGCQGVTLAPPCVTNCGVCEFCVKPVKPILAPVFAFSTANANIFRYRHIDRPVKYVRPAPHPEFPAPADFLKLTATAKLPQDVTDRIKNVLTPTPAK
jgi:hypothetical protein